MARIGSIAAAPFVGNQFASLYLGEDRVPTVPGTPTVTSAGIDVLELLVTTTGGAINNGGSAITGYHLYVNGTLYLGPQASLVDWDFEEEETPITAGDEIRISAVNAIGEGPLSVPVLAFDI